MGGGRTGLTKAPGGRSAQLLWVGSLGQGHGPVSGAPGKGEGPSSVEDLACGSGCLHLNSNFTPGWQREPYRITQKR